MVVRFLLLFSDFLFVGVGINLSLTETNLDRWDTSWINLRVLLHHWLPVSLFFHFQKPQCGKFPSCLFTVTSETAVGRTVPYKLYPRSSRDSTLFPTFCYLTSQVQYSNQQLLALLQDTRILYTLRGNRFLTDGLGFLPGGLRLIHV